MQCPNCHIPMQRGFLIDRHGEHRAGQVLWSSGDFWEYMLNQTEVLPVTTYRCNNCGLLQQAALPQEPSEFQATYHDSEQALRVRAN